MAHIPEHVATLGSASTCSGIEHQSRGGKFLIRKEPGILQTKKWKMKRDQTITCTHRIFFHPSKPLSFHAAKSQHPLTIIQNLNLVLQSFKSLGTKPEMLKVKGFWYRSKHSQIYNLKLKIQLTLKPQANKKSHVTTRIMKSTFFSRNYTWSLTPKDGSEISMEIIISKVFKKNLDCTLLMYIIKQNYTRHRSFIKHFSTFVNINQSSNTAPRSSWFTHTLKKTTIYITSLPKNGPDLCMRFKHL